MASASYDELRALFASIDSDGDEVLDEQELAAFFYSLFSGRQAFALPPGSVPAPPRAPRARAVAPRALAPPPHVPPCHPPARHPARALQRDGAGLRARHGGAVRAGGGRRRRRAL